MGSLFGKFLRVVATEVVKELAKSDDQRRADDERRERKSEAKRARFKTHMAGFERAVRERDERQASAARYQQEMNDLKRGSGHDTVPFEALRDRFVTNAIALVRPYPPHRVPAGRSRVGGLPDLPAGTAWPINREGLPLHFIAQVDLAELPAGDPRPELLPACGTLLFFARMDREMFFDEGDPVRVIFDASSCGVRTAAPADLAPVDDHWERAFAKPGESAPNTLLEWPWQLAGIRSIPATAALEHNAASNPAFEAYNGGLQRLREMEIERATGLKAPTDDHSPDLGIFAARKVREPWQLLPFEQTGFPWTARGFALVCRAVCKRHGKREQIASIIESLSAWQAGAERVAPAEPTLAEEAGALINRLNQAMRADYRDHTYEDGREAKIFNDYMKNSIAVAVHRLISEAGGNPALARALPDDLYHRAYPRHAPITQRGEGQYIRHSQMFGYVPSSQEPLPATSPLLTLIQFASDPGIELVIGDMGEINLDITREDLAAGRWNDVRAWHVGG